MVHRVSPSFLPVPKFFHLLRQISSVGADLSDERLIICRKKSYQDHINEEMARHAQVANEEMGVVKTTARRTHYPARSFGGRYQINQGAGLGDSLAHLGCCHRNNF